MKTAHWSMGNGSGMFRVAEAMVKSEIALGIDAVLCDAQNPATFDAALHADYHISHTHFPDSMRKRVTKPLKLIWVAHGTPEHVFQTAVETGLNKGYGHGDGWMLAQHWLQTADAIVTFWPRHQAIWQSLCDKGRKVHCVPLGVDKTFWQPIASRGKFSGSPSVFTAENAHWIKWPLDLFIAWPWVREELPEAVLHACYLPKDQHRWFFPLVNRNGCSYGAHISPMVFDHDGLRNTFCSVDFFIGLVRYGDFNRLSLEAGSCGVKTISYTGNPYSDFWVPEGDQRVMGQAIVDILTGKTPVRTDKVEIPNAEQTAKAMVEIYQSL